jgi:hypothetical protein
MRVRRVEAALFWIDVLHPLAMGDIDEVERRFVAA